jgi:hypothetical protein
MRVELNLIHQTTKRGHAIQQEIEATRENGASRHASVCDCERGDSHGGGLCYLAERPGSGDGEREASMTRQIAFEPLPASVLFCLVW